MVRVRFAPSPTGNLHIGGARTALFNWLFAKAQNGEFVLRIEDTDTQRSKKEFLDEILTSLKWLGLNWDQIYHQSQRFNIYKEYAQILVKENKAYLQEEAIIFKVQPQKIKINDLIRGDIEFDAGMIKDQVLIKSDGSPTYNFACVVDDAKMQISHVIRGEDHISNTPKQVLLYGALGFDMPDFAHLPLILEKSGGRLSKRTGATAITEYRAMGYLPEALVNHLMLLGWSPGENQEIIDLKEAIKKFSIKHANKTASIFDMDKLRWVNNQYIRKTRPETLVDLILPLLEDKGFIKKDNFDRNYLISLVKLYQRRLDTLQDFIERADFFFLRDIKIDEGLKKKVLTRDYSKEFSLLVQRLNKLDNFDAASIEKEFRALVKELNIPSRELVHPVRLVLTGKTVGPGLFQTMALLGKEKVRGRLKPF